MATNVWSMEIPKSPSNYTKLEEGTVKLRILNPEFIEGYNDRDGKTSIKYRKQDVPENTTNPDGFIYFRATVVRNYDDKMIQIREIKSKQIMNKIKALIKDADRGDNFDYDLKVSKTGVKKDTKYDVIPSGKWPTAKDILKAYKEADIMLEPLFLGIDPFKK